MHGNENVVETVNGENVGWQKKTALFLSSQGLSMFGSMLVQYAIIWHITLSTQSGGYLVIATIAGFLPQIVISLFAGVWADRYPRKRLIIAADLLTAVSTLILAVIFLSGYRELWLLIAGSAVRSVGAGIQAPAVNALLPQIVPSERLIKVNSINGTLQQFMMLAAPLASGGLLSFARLESIFFVDVVTAILAVSLLLVLKTPPLPRSALAPIATGPLDDLKQGLAYVAGNQVIKKLFSFFAFAFFLVAPIAFLTPLLIARSYGNEVWRLTANEVAFSVGSIIGGIIMTMWGGFRNRFRTIGLASIVWGILFAGLGLSRDFTLYLGIMFLAGVPMSMFNVPTTTLLQEVVEPEMQGRVFGVMGLIMNTMLPLGMVVFGPLADFLTVELLLVIASLLLVIPGVWLYLSCDLRIVEPGLAVSDCN